MPWPPEGLAALRRRADSDSRRAVLVVAATVVLLGGVAMVAGMSRPGSATPNAPAIPGGVLFAWTGAAAVVAGLAAGVFGRHWTARERWIGAVLVLLVLGGFALLAERSHPIPTTPVPQATSVPRTPPPSAPPTATPAQSQETGNTPQATSGGTGGLSPLLLTVLGLAALLLAAGALFAGGRRGAGGSTGGAETQAALRRAVADSLRQAEIDPDPRRAVVGAYIGMGEVLAAHGLVREPWEAPLEYMRRALGAVRLSAASVRRLTALFERARFSDHPVGPSMREEALAALRAVHDELDSREDTP